MKNLFVFILLLITTVGYSQASPSTKQHCSALTTKGLPCKNFAVGGDKLCSIHSANSIQCGALTSKGQPCKMRVKVKGEKCWRHKQ